MAAGGKDKCWMYKRVKVDHRLFCSLTFGAMCLLTLFSIAVSLQNDIFRDSVISVKIISSLVSLLFLTLLSGYLFFNRGAIGEIGHFTLFIFNVYLGVFFSALIGSIYGLPDYARQIAAFSGLDYFFSITFFLTLWLYQKKFLEESAMTRAVTVLISTGVIFYTLAIILNIFRPVLFLVTNEGIYSDAVADYISIIIDLFCLVLLSVVTMFSNLSRTRKLSFICCVFSPVLFSVLSLNMDVLNKYASVWGLLTIVFMMTVCLMLFNANDELEKAILRHEKEQTELQVSAMISQMQPHFLYNSLAVIAALCEEDPGLAAKAANEFSDYLRENINFADKSNPISFSEELNHIKTYVWLEKLRFPNRLNIEYDIKCESFPVPALSVQPLVENAIKHGICKTKNGGTVRISSFETDQYYCVTVSDDGVGFDVSEILNDGKVHLGIQNTRYRVREMVNGSLEIVSSPGKGTSAAIKIPK